METHFYTCDTCEKQGPAKKGGYSLSRDDLPLGWRKLTIFIPKDPNSAGGTGAGAIATTMMGGHYLGGEFCSEDCLRKSLQTYLESDGKRVA